MKEVARSVVDLLANSIVTFAVETTSARTNSVEDALERAYFVVEDVAARTGQALMHRQLLVATPNQFMDDLDVLKFACRDWWPSVFGKPIDNLKTNHKGTYALHDQNFLLLRPYKDDVAMPEAGRMATLLLAFPCGFLRGALDIFRPTVEDSSGTQCYTDVSADIVQMPHVAFQVRRPQTTS